MNSAPSCNRSPRAAMSAPMSRCRTRKRRSHGRSRTIARAPSAPPIRCGSTACAALDQYRRRRLFGQSRRLRARLGSRFGQSRRARRRRRRARGGLCAARARRRAHRRGQSDASGAPRPCANASARACTPPAGTSAMPRSTMRRCSSTPRRSAWPGSPISRSKLGACPVTPSSPTSFMCRWSRRSCGPPRARGLRTADGLGMLMHQAVRGFSLWFGKKPEVTAELRALLEADLSLPPANPSE